MMKGILGKKVGMTQVFSNTGELIPVTVIEVPKNIITQVKTKENDDYNAIQIGIEDKREKVSNKPEMGHSKKAKTQPKRFVKELRLNNEEIANYALGQEISLEIFEAGEYVDVQGTSKGKGFQGAVKRHNQKIGPKGHGSRYHRRPGSMGAVAPAVFKGKNLPGHMGDETVTTQNLEIVMVDLENNALLIKGNVPGAKRSFVIIKSSIKKGDIKLEPKDLVGYSNEPELEVVHEETVNEENVQANKEAIAQEEAKVEEAKAEETKAEETKEEVKEETPVEEVKEEATEETKEEEK